MESRESTDWRKLTIRLPVAVTCCQRLPVMETGCQWLPVTWACVVTMWSGWMLQLPHVWIGLPLCAYLALKKYINYSTQWRLTLLPDLLSVFLFSLSYNIMNQMTKDMFLLLTIKWLNSILKQWNIFVTKISTCFLSYITCNMDTC